MDNDSSWVGESRSVIKCARMTLAALCLVSWGVDLAAQGKALTDFERRKAAELLREKLSCLGCHRIGAEGGGIGPDLSRSSPARSAEHVLRIMRSPREVAPQGIMPPVAMPPATARLIASYIATLNEAPRPVTVTPLLRPTATDTGAVLYARLCASCHGATGQGDGPNAAYLPVQPARHASAQLMSGRTDDRLYDGIAAGGAVLGRSPRMPAFGAMLSDAELRALVRHIRVLCRCSGPEWSRDGSQ
jgi:mono/diheme cytochrome c family protein